MHCQDSHTTVTSVMVPYGTVCHAAVRGTHIALHRCHKDSQPWVVACARSPCPREGQEERHELMAVCVLASFPVTVVTSSNRSTEGRKGLFWLAVQGTVHHGGRGQSRAAGTGSSSSHHTLKQEAGSDESRLLFHSYSPGPQPGNGAA